jgi:hypothetical protein
MSLLFVSCGGSNEKEALWPGRRVVTYLWLDVLCCLNLFCLHCLPILFSSKTSTYIIFVKVDAHGRSRLILNVVKNMVKIVWFDQGKIWLCFPIVFNLQKLIEQSSFFQNIVSWTSTKKSCTRTRFSGWFWTGASANRKNLTPVQNNLVRVQDFQDFLWTCSYCTFAYDFCTCAFYYMNWFKTLSNTFFKNPSWSCIGT